MEGAVEVVATAAITRAATSTAAAARAAASRGPRRRTSSTCQSTATSRSPSSSAAVEKVRHPQLHLTPPGGGPNELALRVFWGHLDVLTDARAKKTVTGVLKGYDPLMNLVLDEAKETMRDDEGKETTRPLGLTVARGTLIVLISPVDGSEEIANPFAPAEDD